MKLWCSLLENNLMLLRKIVQGECGIGSCLDQVLRPLSGRAPKDEWITGQSQSILWPLPAQSPQPAQCYIFVFDVCERFHFLWRRHLFIIRNSPRNKIKLPQKTDSECVKANFQTHLSHICQLFFKDVWFQMNKYFSYG